LVRVRFYKPETEKTELNQTESKPKKQAKPRKNRVKPKNQAKPEKPNQTEKTKPNRNRSVWTGFCSKKTEQNLKPVGLNWFRFDFDFFKPV